MGGVPVPLPDQADEITDIPLLDLMNALGTPVGNDVAPQEICNSASGPDIRNVFANKRLDQVINPIDNEPSARLYLLFRRIPPVEPSRKDLLRLRLGHR